MESYYYGVQKCGDGWEVYSYTHSRRNDRNHICLCKAMIVAQRIALALDKEC